MTKHSKLLPDIIVSFDMRKSGISQLEKLEANGKRRTFYWPLEKKHIIYMQGAHNPRIQVPAFQHHLGRLSIHRAPGRRRGSTAATTNGGSRSTQSCNAQALRIEFLGCCQLLQTVETHIWIYLYIYIYMEGFVDFLLTVLMCCNRSSSVKLPVAWVHGDQTTRGVSHWPLCGTSAHGFCSWSCSGVRRNPRTASLLGFPWEIETPVGSSKIMTHLVLLTSASLLQISCSDALGVM